MWQAAACHSFRLIYWASTMERSFKREVEALRLGTGETFHGEGILAVTKALLQSGVSYVSGYPGAPISHMVDVLTDAEDILDELGVHFAPAANEAGAAAMLGASINYPLRGAGTWKSIVGTNVAADALSNLSSPGVMGGVLIILGEDIVGGNGTAGGPEAIGGIWGMTAGLYSKFGPNRVIDTPISESCIVGAAAGAACRERGRRGGASDGAQR